MARQYFTLYQRYVGILNNQPVPQNQMAVLVLVLVLVLESLSAQAKSRHGYYDADPVQANVFYDDMGTRFLIARILLAW